MDLGKTLKDLRKQRGLKQKALASLCEISVTYLSQIENNRKEPSLSTLNKISSKLHFPLPVIFFLALQNHDIPSHKKDIYNSLVPPFKSYLNSFYLDLNE